MGLELIYLKTYLAGRNARINIDKMENTLKKGYEISNYMFFWLNHIKI